MFSMPAKLVKDLEKYAELLHDGNRSGFVAEAVADKISYLRKAYHTQKMREAYAQSAKESLRISKEWELLDDELWQQLDEIESKGQ